MPSPSPEAARAAIDACLREAAPAMLTRCIALDLDCAALCRLMSVLIARGSRLTAAVAAPSVQACQACAQECAQHAHDHCQHCAQACRACADACAGLQAGAVQG